MTSHMAFSEERVSDISSVTATFISENMVHLSNHLALVVIKFVAVIMKKYTVSANKIIIIMMIV